MAPITKLPEDGIVLENPLKHRGIILNKFVFNILL